MEGVCETFCIAGKRLSRSTFYTVGVERFLSALSPYSTAAKLAAPAKGRLRQAARENVLCELAGNSEQPLPLGFRTATVETATSSVYNYM